MDWNLDSRLNEMDISIKTIVSTFLENTYLRTDHHLEVLIQSVDTMVFELDICMISDNIKI